MRGLIAILAVLGGLLLVTSTGAQAQNFFTRLFMSEPTHRSDRLFKTAHDGVAYDLAQRIERGEAITAADVAPFAEDINRRYGEDITLLFHAVASGNLSAVDAILGSGADMRQPDKSVGSSRDFIYYLGLPGGFTLDQDGITEMIRLYLKHGGNPNVRSLGERQQPLVSTVALMQNIDGFFVLLEAGADPWAQTLKGGQPDGGSAMIMLASEGTQYDTLNRLIDAGWFDEVNQTQLADFFSALGGYAQRGDDRSLSIKQVAMRVLKRNPDYTPPPGSGGTARIFKDHYDDPLPGAIPWDLIRSDAVQ